MFSAKLEAPCTTVATVFGQQLELHCLEPFPSYAC